MTAADLAALLSGYRFAAGDEYRLQDAVALALTNAGITYEREVRLGPRDRVDFLVGDVAVEVKVRGKPDATHRQLRRYAASDSVASLLLVTTHGGAAPR